MCSARACCVRCQRGCGFAKEMCFGKNYWKRRKPTTSFALSSFCSGCFLINNTQPSARPSSHHSSEPQPLCVRSITSRANCARTRVAAADLPLPAPLPPPPPSQTPPQMKRKTKTKYPAPAPCAAAAGHGRCNFQQRVPPLNRQAARLPEDTARVPRASEVLASGRVVDQGPGRHR